MTSTPFESIISLHGDYGTCLDIFPAFPVIHTVESRINHHCDLCAKAYLTFIELGKRPLISAETVSA
jgi:hypothetical protein